MGKKVSFKNFEGQEYEISLRKPRKELEADGLCYPPKDNAKSKILVNPHLKKEKIKEVILHEMLHAFFWELPEYKINYLAKTASQIIKKLT